MITTIANRIYIDDPTSEVEKWAKENLKFPNPEYEKKQRMGYWVGRTPKELRLYEWDGNTLILPFGVIRTIMPLLRGTRVESAFKQDNVIDYGKTPMNLYDYQMGAVSAMVSAKYGILKAPCGAGKTNCGIALIKAFRRRALWLCNKHDLIRQSMDRAAKFIDPNLFGTITEGNVFVGIGITFATVQTMCKLDLTKYRDYWDVVIIDECHSACVSATSFTMYEKVLNHLAARHKIGLTATDHRADGLIKATFAMIGNVAYEIPKEAVADRVTDVKIRKVVTETDLTDDCLGTDGMINYTALMKHIVTDRERNKLIARKIMEEKDHSCIILSDRLEQLEVIRNLLPYEMQEKSVYINGKMTSKAAKKEREQGLEQMRTGEKKYLFASYKIAREGLDIPCLDRLFMASPVKDPAVVEQSVGRIRRTADGKNDVPVVYDFEDSWIGMCAGWYKKRCTVYRKIGAEIEKTWYEPSKNP